jgi:hypothetical protein
MHHYAWWHLVQPWDYLLAAKPSGTFTLPDGSKCNLWLYDDPSTYSYASYQTLRTFSSVTVDLLNRILSFRQRNLINDGFIQMVRYFNRVSRATHQRGLKWTSKKVSRLH